MCINLWLSSPASIGYNHHIKKNKKKKAVSRIIPTGVTAILCFTVCKLHPSILSHLDLTTASEIRYYSSYFIDEETEGQRRCVTFARPYRREVTKPGLGIQGKENTVESSSLPLNVSEGIG